MALLKGLLLAPLLALAGAQQLLAPQRHVVLQAVPTAQSDPAAAAQAEAHVPRDVLLCAAAPGQGVFPDHHAADYVWCAGNGR